VTNRFFSYHAGTVQTDLSSARPQCRREPGTDYATWKLFHAGKYQAKGCHPLSGLLSVSAATNPPGTLVAPEVPWWSQIKVFSFDLPAV